jgi:hypothetical protein
MTGLTKDQVKQLLNDPSIQATEEENKAKAKARRESDLMLLGYNQALLDVGKPALPKGWTVQKLQGVVNKQREKLGI